MNLKGIHRLVRLSVFNKVFSIDIIFPQYVTDQDKDESFIELTLTTSLKKEM